MRRKLNRQISFRLKNYRSMALMPQILLNLRLQEFVPFLALSWLQRRNWSTLRELTILRFKRY
jgi:hypothetical protein